MDSPLERNEQLCDWHALRRAQPYIRKPHSTCLALISFHGLSVAECLEKVVEGIAVNPFAIFVATSSLDFLSLILGELVTLDVFFDHD